MRRSAVLVLSGLFALAMTFSVTSCGSGAKRTASYETTPPTTAAGSPISATKISPEERVRKIEAMWKSNLRAGAKANPRYRFHNLSRASFIARLAEAAARYHFRAVRVRFLQPRQAAPFVVIETANKHTLAASTGAILKLIDPKRDTGDDRTGWAYEGFLLEERDAHGLPFIAAFNWWRGPHAGGGQWAADPSLSPFPHG